MRVGNGLHVMYGKPCGFVSRDGGFQVGESQGLPLREIFTGVEISPKFSPKINNFSASGAEASNTLDVFNDFKVGPLHTE